MRESQTKPRQFDVHRDQSVLEEFERIISSPVGARGKGRTISRENPRLAFKIIWDHGPNTGNCINKIGDNPILHTYLADLMHAGWLQKIGKTSVGATGRAKASLWEITGKIGRNLADRRNSPPPATFIRVESIDDKSGRRLWTEIAETVRKYYRPKLAGLDPSDTADAMKRIGVEVDIMRESINSWTSASMQNSGATSASREKLRSACRMLGIKPPSAGRPIKIDRARRAMRNLAKAYHPDFNPGGADNFRKVMDAFHLVESYTDNKTKEA